MKTLSSYIITEYKGHAIRNKETSIGDPDEIKHYFAQGWVHLKFSNNNAYPYVYNIKTHQIIIGDKSTIHNNIFSPKNEKKLKEMGLENVQSIQQIRYCCGLDEDTDEIDKWYEENKKYIDSTICGRIWYNAQDNFESWDDAQIEIMSNVFDKLDNLDSCKCYIANWNEIAPTEFQKITDDIVKQFAKKHSKKIDSYIAIDNNGEPQELTIGDNITVDKRSAENEKRIVKVYNIHVPKEGESQETFRKRKNKELSKYRTDRDSKLQTDYYNKTQSKTAAEFHNKKTQRYNPLTGKMEWGEKIGDSLIDNINNINTVKQNKMKSILYYILENQKDNVGCEKLFEIFKKNLYSSEPNDYNNSYQLTTFKYSLKEDLLKYYKSSGVKVTEDNGGFEMEDLVDSDLLVLHTKEDRSLRSSTNFSIELISGWEYSNDVHGDAISLELSKPDISKKSHSLFYHKNGLNAETIYNNRKPTDLFYIVPKGTINLIIKEGWFGPRDLKK